MCIRDRHLTLAKGGLLHQYAETVITIYDSNQLPEVASTSSQWKKVETYWFNGLQDQCRLYERLEHFFPANANELHFSHRCGPTLCEWLRHIMPSKLDHLRSFDEHSDHDTDLRHIFYWNDRWFYTGPRHVNVVEFHLFLRLVRLALDIKASVPAARILVVDHYAAVVKHLQRFLGAVLETVELNHTHGTVLKPIAQA